MTPARRRDAFVLLPEFSGDPAAMPKNQPFLKHLGETTVSVNWVPEESTATISINLCKACGKNLAQAMAKALAPKKVGRHGERVGEAEFTSREREAVAHVGDGEVFSVVTGWSDRDGKLTLSVNGRPVCWTRRKGKR